MPRRLLKKTVYEYDYTEDIDEVESEYIPNSDSDSEDEKP